MRSASSPGGPRAACTAPRSETPHATSKTRPPSPGPPESSGAATSTCRPLDVHHPTHPRRPEMFTIAILVGNGHTVTVTGQTADEFKTNVVWVSENAPQLIAATKSLEAHTGASVNAPAAAAAPAGPAPSC